MPKRHDPHANHLFRVEIFLTLSDRNGVEIKSHKFRPIIMDIYGKFHGLTMTAIEGNPVFEGYWRHKKALMHEKTSIVTVLIPQKELQFFRDRKPIWRKLLNYKELLRTL